SQAVAAASPACTPAQGDETFLLTLTNPTGGASIADAQGQATITNDDAAPPVTGAVWINEFHYDNSGADADEFIEIAGPAGLDLSGYSLILYNGNGGVAYNTRALTGVFTN